MKCNMRDECKVIYFRHINALIAVVANNRFSRVCMCVLLSIPNNQLVVGHGARDAGDLVDAA